MWNVNGTALKMAEGDWGIALPIKISGVTLGANDSVRITIKSSINGMADTAILTKDYSGITDNTVNLELTEDESELLPIGVYLYSLDWYQNGSFMCNIITRSTLEVVDKV